MADNSQKTPFGRSLNKFGEKKINDAMQLLGKALSVTVVGVYGRTNSIVTVQFNVKPPTGVTLPQITIPVFGPEYIRYPIQPGDQGITVPADVLLGSISGLGTGQPTLGVLPANLQGLVYLPIGNNNWSATDDAQKTVIYGPNGAVLRDTANQNSVVVQHSDGSVTVTAHTTLKLQVGSSNITITSNQILVNGVKFDLSQNITQVQEITNVGGHTLTQHTHTQPNDSHGDTEAATNTPTG